MVKYELLVVACLCQLANGKCGAPGWSVNGSNAKHKSFYETGETIVYSCRVGFHPVGSNHATCQEDGSWSQPPTPCAKDWLHRRGMQLIRTDSEESEIYSSHLLEGNPRLLTDRNDSSCLDIPHNATTLFSLLTERVEISVIRFVFINEKCFLWINIFVDDQTCHFNGSIPETGVITVRCAEQLTGSHVEIQIWIQCPLTICEIQAYSDERDNKLCGTPAAPLNGFIRNQSADQFKFVCDVNFDLMGPDINRCINGSWSNETPKCIDRQTWMTHSNSCRTLPDLENGLVEYSGSSVSDEYPTSAKYSCSKGYTLIGNETRHCIDGSWTGQQSICKSIDCGPIPEEYYFLINGTGLGAVLVHRCPDSEKITYSICTENGWRSSVDTCSVKLESYYVGVAVILLVLIIIAISMVRKKIRSRDRNVATVVHLEPLL